MNRWSIFPPVLLLTLLVCTGPVYAQQKEGENSLESEQTVSETGKQGVENEKGVIIKVDVGLIRWEPSIFSPVKFRMEKGAAASVVETRGEWYLIKLENGRTGWANQVNLMESVQTAGNKGLNTESGVSRPAQQEGTAAQQEVNKTRAEALIKSENDLMSINFLNVDIREALSALAMEREINIATAKDVSGNVSVHLYQVSLDQALNAITLAGGFSYYKRGDLFYIYKPKEAMDPEADRLEMKMFKLKYGETDKIQEILEAIQGVRTIKIDDSSKTIFVEDTPENIARIEKVISHWDQMPKQVLIEAKILEIRLTDDMTFGVNWADILGDVRLETGGFSTSAMPTTGPVSPLPASGTGLFGNLILAAGTEQQIAAALDLLQSKTRVNTLSTPKILAIHGKTAKVQVGGQQGYRVTTTNVGVATETIQFIDTGTVLEITPYIDDDDNILLNVKPSISSANIDQGVPVVSTTLVETWLLAKNGETIFIGGLIQDADAKTRDMIPCLGNIPGLGSLFGRTVSKIGKVELVILITPSIMNAEFRRVNLEAIEKTKKIDEKFRKEPQPDYKRYWDFLKPVY